MSYDPERTPSLTACLQTAPGREFTASELKERTLVPKKFVRRALTVDDPRVAEVPMDGVTMEKKDGRWHYSWTGPPCAGQAPQDSN